jgi:nitrogen fixation/metabolism regulation signal transduction histidine kinase
VTIDILGEEDMKEIEKLNALQYVATLVNKVDELRNYVDMTKDEFYNFSNSPEFAEQRCTFSELSYLLSEVIEQAQAAHEHCNSIANKFEKEE